MQSDRSSFQVGDEFVGTVEKLIFGGNGLIRLPGGLVVQIPYVVPSEEVRGRVCRLFRSYLVGRLESVLHSSPFRTEPVCSHFGLCGGCHLQHSVYDQHESIKKGWLREALFSLGIDSLPLEWSSSSKIWQWRKKITLHAQRVDGDILLGYYEPSSHKLFSCCECPLFFDQKEAEVLSCVREALSYNRRWTKGEVRFFRRFSGSFYFGTDPTIAVHFFLDKRFTKEEMALVRSRFPTLILEQGDEEEDFLTFCFHNMSFFYAESAFIQTHPEQPFVVWEDLCSHMKKWRPKRAVWDLYSGIGVTAALAASCGHSVQAVEISKEAVLSCRKTIQQAGIEGVRVVCSSVERFLSSTKNSQVDIILINPPRQGLSKEVLQHLVSLRAEEIHYISCNPATLRRDLMAFCRAGWKIVWVKGYDMFPQTTHFETYVKLCIHSQNA